MDGVVVVLVLQHGSCQHAGFWLAVRDVTGAWRGGSGAHLAGRVFLARSLRRQRRVHVSINTSSISARAVAAAMARSLTLSVY